MTKALFLTTKNSDMTAYGGIKWPTSGKMIAPDKWDPQWGEGPTARDIRWGWVPDKECGAGLHGLLWGKGNWGLLSNKPDAIWIVFEADEESAIDLTDKHKVKECEVVYCGKASGAIRMILDRLFELSKEKTSSTTGKYAHSSTTGDESHSSTTGYSSHSSTTGDESIACALGLNSKAMAHNGVIVLSYFDGKRIRVATGYTGENGIKPDQWYKVDNNGTFIETSEND